MLSETNHVAAARYGFTDEELDFPLSKLRTGTHPTATNSVKVSPAHSATRVIDSRSGRRSRVGQARCDFNPLSYFHRRDVLRLTP